MAKKRNRSSASSSDSSSEEETKKKTTKVVSSKAVVSSDSDSSSDDDDEWNAKPKAKAKGKRGRAIKKPPPKVVKKKLKTSDSDKSSSSSSSSEEENEPPKKKKPTKARGRAAGREEKEEGEVEDFSSNDDNDEEMVEFNDGFDENLMGDDDDQRMLANMTEKEREQELFNRSEKREVLRTRWEIERKLRLAKKQDMKEKKKKVVNKVSKKSTSTPAVAPAVSTTITPATTTTANDDESLAAFLETSRSVERRRNMEGKSKVTDAIKGLKAEREKKKLKQKLRAADVYSDSSDSDSGSDAPPKTTKKTARKASSSSDSSSSSSMSDDDSDTDAKPKGKSEKESRRRTDNDWDKGRSSGDEEAELFNCTLEVLNSLRLSRFKLEKWCHAPFFKDTVVGCYVRMGVGSAGQAAQYIVGQIVDVVETPRVYLLGKMRTNKGIKIKYAKAPERVYRIEYVSNQEFPHQEWDKWYTKMVAERCDFPSRDFVERKKADIQKALNYQFSDGDVAEIVAEKLKFRQHNPVNFAMRKSELMKEKQFAEQNHDLDKAMELSREIDRLEDEAKKIDMKRTKNIAAISFINERNRMGNIRAAEIAIAEAAKEDQNKGDDPFTRRKCAPTMISKFNKKGEGALADVTQGNATELTGGSDSINSKIPATYGPSKNGTKSALNSKAEPADSDDLFNAHNFEIKIEFDLPLPGGSVPSSANAFNGGMLSSFNGANGRAANGFADSRPLSMQPANSGVNRRSLNLDEYKKKKGLI